jgi:hypothetical protein
VSDESFASRPYGICNSHIHITFIINTINIINVPETTKQLLISSIQITNSKAAAAHKPLILMAAALVEQGKAWVKQQYDETVTSFREMHKRQMISQVVNLGEHSRGVRA